LKNKSFRLAQADARKCLELGGPADSSHLLILECCVGLGQAGLQKTRFFLKKTSPWFFFVFFLGGVGFLVFFYIFAQKREFLGFFQFQEYF
jgi:hypothetical protein